MPYIKPEFREKLQPHIDNLLDAMYNLWCDHHDMKGVMNYVITKIITSFLLQIEGYNKKSGAKWRYHSLCDVIGTLECAKLEIYRRLVGPYEDGAVCKNGDLSEFLTYI